MAGLLKILLPRLCILEAKSTASGWEYSVYEASVRKDGTDIMEVDFGIIEKKAKIPVTLIIHGQGIVSKRIEKDSDFAKNIMANGKEFISSTEETAAGTVLIFMRKDLYDSLMENLKKYKLPLTSVNICASDAREKERLGSAEEHFGNGLMFRNMLRPGAYSDTVNALLARRLLLPVAGIVLAALCANLLISRSLQTEIERQSYALGRINSDNSRKEKDAEEAGLFYRQLDSRPSLPYSFIADRIAAAVPDGMVLSEIAINPLRNAIKEDEMLAIEANAVVIKGVSEAAKQITAFTDAIRTHEFVNSLELSSVGQEKNGRFRFEIIIGL